MQKSGQRPAFQSIFSGIFSLFIKVFRIPGAGTNRRRGRTPLKLAGLRRSTPNTAHPGFHIELLPQNSARFF
jgi:hypothetical protein